MKTVKDEKQRLLELMGEFDPFSSEYAELTKQFSILHDVEKTSFSIHNSATQGVVGNLVGIFTILAYEHAHVITSRALSLIRK
jgi:hypothetical protein